MDHADHVSLLRKAITPNKGFWADLGSGTGAFTLALRDLAGPDVQIISIDNDSHRLAQQRKFFELKFPQSNIKFLDSDFTDLDKLPSLDGVIMANSLHYVKDQLDFLKKLHAKLKDGGKLVLVEYNSDQGNPWVPFPVSLKRFIDLSKEAGFKEGEFIAAIPSTWLNEIYSALAFK